MGVEKVCKDDTACTFEFLFRFNRVWINSRLLVLLLFCVHRCAAVFQISIIVCFDLSILLLAISRFRKIGRS